MRRGISNTTSSVISNSGQNACFLAELRKGIIERAYALPLLDVIFRPQMHQKRWAAGLRPDPLGELKRSSDPLAAVGGIITISSRSLVPIAGKGGEWNGCAWNGQR